MLKLECAICDLIDLERFSINYLSLMGIPRLAYTANFPDDITFARFYIL